MDERPRPHVEHYRYHSKQVENLRSLELGEDNDVIKPRPYVKGRGFLFIGQDMLYKFLDKDDKRRAEYTPSVRGGRTRAWIDIGGRTFEAEAKCMMSDNFSYRRGKAIAMGRLRKQLEEADLLDKVSFPERYLKKRRQ